MFNPVSNINTSQVSTINNNTQNLDLKELINQNRKLIEVTENQTRVLSRESEMTRRSKQKLQVAVQDFGTDINMLSSRVEFG
jgi:EAL domain-containing protein (putative c-di-GMP-specific phosphodiesterase class I)